MIFMNFHDFFIGLISINDLKEVKYNIDLTNKQLPWINNNNIKVFSDKSAKVTLFSKSITIQKIIIAKRSIMIYYTRNWAQ